MKNQPWNARKMFMLSTQHTAIVSAMLLGTACSLNAPHAADAASAPQAVVTLAAAQQLFAGMQADSGVQSAQDLNSLSPVQLRDLLLSQAPKENADTFIVGGQKFSNLRQQLTAPAATAALTSLGKNFQAGDALFTLDESLNLKASTDLGQSVVSYTSALAARLQSISADSSPHALGLDIFEAKNNNSYGCHLGVQPEVQIGKNHEAFFFIGAGFTGYACRGVPWIKAILQRIPHLGSTMAEAAESGAQLSANAAYAYCAGALATLAAPDVLAAHTVRACSTELNNDTETSSLDQINSQLDDLKATEGMRADQNQADNEALDAQIAAQEAQIAKLQGGGSGNTNLVSPGSD